MSLVTLIKAKQHPALSSLNGTYLQAILDACSDAAENYCNRKFLSTAYAEIRDGDDSYNIYVLNPPIISLTSVAVKESDGTSTTYTDLTHDPVSGKIRYQSDKDAVLFINGFQNVTINYTGGYATIPEAVQQAIILMSYNTCKRTVSSGTTPGMRSENLDMYSYTREDSGGDYATASPFSPDVKMLLDPYRRLSI